MEEGQEVQVRDAWLFWVKTGTLPGVSANLPKPWLDGAIWHLEPARERKERFHSWTFAGVIDPSFTAWTLSSHFWRPPLR